MSRMVQCPKCRAILQEPPNNLYYKCGSCFTVLQAKHGAGKAENLAQPNNPSRPRDNHPIGSGLTIQPGPRPATRQENLPPNQNRNGIKKSIITQQTHNTQDMRKQFADDLRGSRKSMTMPSESALRNSSITTAGRNSQGIIRMGTDDKIRNIQLSQDRMYFGKSSMDSSSVEPLHKVKAPAGNFQPEISNKTILLRQQMLFKNMRRTLTSEDEDTEFEEAVYRRQKSMPGKLSDNESPSLERTKTFHGADSMKDNVDDDASSQADSHFSRMNSVEMHEDEHDSGFFRRQKTLPSRMSKMNQDDEESEDEEEEEDEEDLRIYRRMKTLPSLMPDSNNDNQSMSVPPRLLDLLDNNSSTDRQGGRQSQNSKSKNLSENGRVVLPERLKVLLNKNAPSSQAASQPSASGRSKKDSHLLESDQLLRRRMEALGIKTDRALGSLDLISSKHPGGRSNKSNSVSAVENAIRGHHVNKFKNVTKPPKLDIPWVDSNREDDLQSEVEDSPLRAVLENKFSAKAQTQSEHSLGKPDTGSHDISKEGKDKKEEVLHESKPSSADSVEPSSLSEGQNGKKENGTEEGKSPPSKVVDSNFSEKDTESSKSRTENQGQSLDKLESPSVDGNNVLPELTRSLSLRTRKLLIGLESVEADVKLHNKAMLKSKSFISRHKEGEDKEIQHEDEEQDDDEIDQEKEDKMFKKSKTLPNTGAPNQAKNDNQGSQPSNEASEPPPLSQIPVNSNLPTLPPPDAPQVVQCQHCYQMLAVPSNLPPQKKPIQKLRCGKCFKVSSFSVPPPPVSTPETGLNDFVPPQTKENIQHSESQISGPDPSLIADEDTESRRKPRTVQFLNSSRGSGDQIPASLTDNTSTRQNLGGRRGSSDDTTMANGRKNGGLKDQNKRVTVNGKEIPGRMLEKAEKLAGPIESGDYWYDKWAGFWGVMGGPCLGIIPSFIPEFDGEMYRGCANGRTGIEINGRELHRRDLEVLMQRGLSSQSGRCYSIDISGNVIDEATGMRLRGLGKLAPSLEERKCGRGMFNP